MPYVQKADDKLSKKTAVEVLIVDGFFKNRETVFDTFLSLSVLSFVDIHDPHMPLDN